MDRKVKAKLKELHPELKLPKNWDFNVGEDYRVEFITPEGEKTYNNPTYGRLPGQWILKLVKLEEGYSPMYYNPETHKRTSQDPRHMKEHLNTSKKADEIKIVANIIKNNKKFDLRKFVREPVGTKSVRDNYFSVHDIDKGDGSIGGMNGGVFVVGLKKAQDKDKDRVYIEKRFKPNDVDVGKHEIQMLHRVFHGGLCNYIQGFVVEHANPAASLYMEFCDRGSLENLIKAYGDKRKQGQMAQVPEGFVWHVLLGLVDGLAYLECGASIADGVKPDPKWTPILHRDIKPDNVMLRSRTTLGSSKYFYTILSDFGLACEDRDDEDPKADHYQVRRAKLGTTTFWAPELLYHPYPKPYYPGSVEDQTRYFPPGFRHSKRSDLWAVGASVYNLCASSERFGDALSHLNLKGWTRIPGMTQTRWLGGTASLVDPLRISGFYSKELKKAIAMAMEGDPRERPSPVSFVSKCQSLSKAAGFGKQVNNKPLPDWATKLHDYSHKANEIRKANGW